MYQINLDNIFIIIQNNLPGRECGKVGVNTYSLELLRSAIHGNNLDTSQIQREILCKELLLE